MTNITFKYNGKKRTATNVLQGLAMFIFVGAMIAIFTIGGEDLFRLQI